MLQSKWNKQGRKGTDAYVSTYAEKVADTAYTPNKLLEHLMEKFALKTDTQLAALLGVEKSTVSFIRTRKLLVSAKLVLRIYDLTGWSIEEIRQRGGID